MDTSNLHRQFIHREADAGRENKAVSAARLVAQLNSGVKTVVHASPLESGNALELVSGYDCVVDASDNPRTRYLVSDACVLAGKPLVSGSAIGLEGQLTVYNFEGGPCYRCAYPNPPAAAASCSDSGVVGPVPAVIGNLQSLEALKVIGGFGAVLSEKLIMYDARSTTFHRFIVKKRPGCAACGLVPTITSMAASDAFCMERSLRGVASGGCAFAPRTAAATPKHLTPPAAAALASGFGRNGECGEVSALEYSAVRAQGVPHALIDVRDATQFEMCALPGSFNVPVSRAALAALLISICAKVPRYFTHTAASTLRAFCSTCSLASCRAACTKLPP